MAPASFSFVSRVERKQPALFFFTLLCAPPRLSFSVSLVKRTRDSRTPSAAVGGINISEQMHRRSSDFSGSWTCTMRSTRGRSVLVLANGSFFSASFRASRLQASFEVERTREGKPPRNFYHLFSSEIIVLARKIARSTYSMFLLVEKLCLPKAILLQYSRGKL